MTDFDSFQFACTLPPAAKKEILKAEMKKKLLEKYGGEEHLEQAPLDQATDTF